MPRQPGPVAPDERPGSVTALIQKPFRKAEIAAKMSAAFAAGDWENVAGSITYMFGFKRS